MGVYILDRILYTRTYYHFGGDALRILRRSLFRPFAQEIAKQSVTGVSIKYTPPPANTATERWTTFIHYKDRGNNRIQYLAMDGMESAEEARWLGPLLAQWGSVPLKKGFSDGFEEADPDELPKL